jgi:hypothetical protein
MDDVHLISSVREVSLMGALCMPAINTGFIDAVAVRSYYFHTGSHSQELLKIFLTKVAHPFML